MSLPLLTATGALRGPRYGAEVPPKYPSVDLANGLVPMSTGGECVYLYGTVAARFPSLSLEKEFYQAMGTDDSTFNVSDEAGLYDLNETGGLNAAIYAVLSRQGQPGDPATPNNLYIARDMCWVFQTPSEADGYVIEPGSTNQLQLLVESLKPGSNGKPNQVAMIGRQGPLLSNPACYGFELPSIHLAKLTTPPVNSITSQIPGTNASQLTELVNQALQLVDNPGNTDGDRALNYVLLNDVAFYSQAYGERYPSSGTGSVLSGARTVPVFSNRPNQRRVKVVFRFSNEATGAEEAGYSVVDVSSEFPYLVSDFTRYLPRYTSEP